MKDICITNGVFMSGVTLKQGCKGIIDVYTYGAWVGFIDTNDSKLKYKFTTHDTKYYTIERR